MKNLFNIFIFLFLFSMTENVFCQSITWSDNIACIIYSHCTNCHNPNGVAPFSLVTYSEVYQKRFDIVNSINGRHMPPWPPDNTFISFKNSREMSYAEVQLINAWVTNGANLGDTTEQLPMPSYLDNPIIQNPDLLGGTGVVTIAANPNGEERCFVVTNPTASDRYISQMEILPGNRSRVHHVIIFQDTSFIPLYLDSLDPEPGYFSYGDVGSPTAMLIGGWTPGTDVISYPQGMGIKLSANARILLQIHYSESGFSFIDSTKIQIMFSSDTVIREITYISPVNHTENLVDTPFIILPNSISTFTSVDTIHEDLTVVNIAPHAHEICVEMECFGISPNQDTIPLIKIDEWNMSWQGVYNYKHPIKIPAGTVVYGRATYNNTVNNKHNPYSPPVTIYDSSDPDLPGEMMLFFMGTLPYVTDDESLYNDTIDHLDHYLNCEFHDVSNSIVSPDSKNPQIIINPNPATDFIRVSLPLNKEFYLAVYNSMGQLVLSLMAHNQLEFDLSGLQKGLYFAEFSMPDAIDKKTIKLALH